MSPNRIGKIKLKKLSDLQGNHLVDNDADPIDIPFENKTPEKSIIPKKAQKAYTTVQKNSDNQKSSKIIASSTAIKRTGIKEPLPGQLRIDAFFKSSTKNYKVESVSRASPQETKLRSKARRGRKRLFHESSSSTAEHIEIPIRKRTQPQRRVKAKCNRSPDEFIDLCSEEETESITSPTLLRVSNTRVHDMKPSKPKVSPMVAIPRQVLQENIMTEDNANKNINAGRKRKPCPPYKIVENTTFVVDGFQFGDIPNITHYFLSHYHADHYIGLTKKFSHPLYMSPITASLVRTFIPIDNQYIHEIEVDQPINLNGIEVTAIDANHCPGAVMLLFKLRTGECILHTGDFRAGFEMESLPIFWNQPDIDLLYLDTTYMSKNYDFCHQSISIDRVCTLVREFHKKNANKRILHVCGSYLIGKEKVWMALAEQFDLRVWTEPNRCKAINCLNWPELKLRLCGDPFQANLHVINMGKLSYLQLNQYFKPFEGKYDMLLGIRPSGWEKNSKPSYGKRISLIGVEYSEHSSYKELERFVRFIKPNRVISTVPVNRDLFKTATVPAMWYKYKGCGRMISIGYQPTISTYLQNPQINMPRLINTSTGMILSPLEKDDVENSKVQKQCLPTDASVLSVSDAAVQPLNRLVSDASDDFLSIV